MMPDAFVDEYPCEHCECLKPVGGEPPEDVCSASPTGDRECDTMQAIGRVAKRAEQIADLISREPDKRLRAVEAEQMADAIANTLWEMGAEFADRLFWAACNVAAECRACTDRTPGDCYEIMCSRCNKLVAA